MQGTECIESETPHPLSQKKRERGDGAPDSSSHLELVWHRYCVDYVDHSIRLEHVGDNHSRHTTFFVFQHDVRSLHHGCERAVTDGLQRGLPMSSANLLLQFGRTETSRHDMVGEDLGERVFVLRLQQVLNCACR